MPSTERTPLIQQVPIADYRERYPNHLLRRYCTIALTTIPLLTVVIVLLSVAIGGESDVFGEHEVTAPSYLHSTSFGLRLPHASWPESDGLDYTELKKILQETPDPEKAREWSKYYTAGPHLCGKNLSQAEWTRDKWAEFGIPHTEIVSYDMHLNYPVDHRLALLENDEVIYEATLEEDVIPEDPTTGLSDRVPTFHGYSASGNVTASYAFCNYGTFYDFEDLRDAGVELEGKIALVKYGHVFRGLKVKRASELGMVGVIMYSDPGDDGQMTEQNGYKPYPDGPARNPSSVQRGSVQYLSVAPGDPTTIGYPSKPGAPRESTEGIIPDIPSLPISYAEALPLLKALNGHGPNVSSFSKYWHTGGLGYKGVEYNIGPTPKSLTINLMNEQDYVITPAWNAIGIINGSISDEVVVLGNHRDAWIAGGAGDPNSGSAALNEVIRAFGVALSKGWKPLRTIVFASWDGEEYGLLGSTEWVEEYIPWLSESTVAYINVDVGARGSNFQASAAPLLNKALLEVTAEVQSPNQTVKGQSVRDTWDGYISTMGSGSDFTAFQDFAGIPSIDVGFGGGPEDPVYHYHSNYDSFWWMDNFGDPGFEHHIAIAKILALLTAKLAEEPVVQFNATDYAFGLQKYLQDAKDEAAGFGIGMLSDSTFEPLHKAIEAFQRASATFDDEASRLSQQALSSPSTTMTTELYQSVRTINTKYKLLERQFLYAAGLDGRSWFKHVIFAPGLWTGYAGKTYPGLVEAIDERNQSAVDRWVDIIEGTINRATDLLIPE
ncbi:hypothetical protein LTR37_006412 [Vermiconidia calcicola]|uniref:Uncharacterized protein n=1 Tax=Vermiconidia calcicola TaxID=1690605 RepID=A0ACC3NI40_9PEZI|nr:hypothetical protein LTR37_006412 [Vermiconidia calcicola]